MKSQNVLSLTTFGQFFEGIRKSGQTKQLTGEFGEQMLSVRAILHKVKEAVKGELLKLVISNRIMIPKYIVPG